MPPRSSVRDWDALKPEILRLVSAGETHQDVIEKLSRKGIRLKKHQLEYRLNRWGQRTNLTGPAWRYVSHRVRKRARDKKESAVFFNGGLISKDKCVKESRRYDLPTLLTASGGLVLLSISLNKANVDFSCFTLSQFPGTSVELCGMRKAHFGLEKLDQPYMDLLGWSDNDQAGKREAAPPRVEHCESQFAIILGLQIFLMSNKLSTGDRLSDRERLHKLGNTVKFVAETTPKWKIILTAGAGATSRALIEQLFAFSITSRDKYLTRLMLQVEADPNQQVFDSCSGMCLSALDYSIAHSDGSTTNLLLNSGAVLGQMSLKHAFEARDLDTAALILRSNQSLDLNFNYLDTLNTKTVPRLSRLKLEKATLPGLVCLDMGIWPCVCHKSLPTPIYSHLSSCPRHVSIVCLEFLIQKGAELTLDTMILASFTADFATLQFLMQHGGNVDGQNRFGFSCFDAACIDFYLQYDVISLILASSAATNTTRAHYAVEFRASLIHRLLLACGNEHANTSHSICEIVDLLIESGSDINYRVQQVGSPVELALAHERFLWSQPTYDRTPADLIADSKAESPLEYAVVLGCESVARTLIDRSCLLTGREMTLAAKVGSVSVLKALIERDQSKFDKEGSGRIALQLGLRWGNETIVQFLLDKGVNFDAYDMIDALQYPGKSVLSSKIQMDLIKATPELDRLQIFGLSLLELCFLKFKREPVRWILRRFPTAFDSGALSALALRALNLDVFYIDVEDMASRRRGNDREWEKENTAVLFAAMYDLHTLRARYPAPRRPPVWRGRHLLRFLAPPGSTCAIDTARIPRAHFTLFLDPRCSGFLDPRDPAALFLTDPTHILGCQDWVSCSPLIGVALAPTPSEKWSIAEDILDHLLACSYEPDALTVVIASAWGNLLLLQRLVCLKNWRSILSIDDDRRPLWCPTALQAAASHGNEEVVEFLLEAGTSVNEAAAEEPIGNCLPRTALQAAVDKGNLKLTNLFIERGARINAPAAEDSGATALQLACIHGYLAISILLLELGADVNARGAEKNGRTALEGAAEHGRIDTIQLLLNHGVCTEGAYREQYLKAVLYAESNRHFAAAGLLREHRQWSADDEERYKTLRAGGLDQGQ